MAYHQLSPRKVFIATCFLLSLVSQRERGLDVWGGIEKDDGSKSVVFISDSVTFSNRDREVAESIREEIMKYTSQFSASFYVEIDQNYTDLFRFPAVEIRRSWCGCGSVYVIAL